MAKKSLGHIELQWTCPNCGTINPGPVKVCEGCGAPQPEDVEFHQAKRQELVTDEDKLAQAKAGADIHCVYCGTRNPAGAKVCSQCKADLSEGAQRKAGRVVGAFKTGPAQQIACPHCGAENPDTAKKCSQCGGSLARIREERTREGSRQAAKPKPKRGSFAAIGVVLVIVLAVIAFLYFRISEVSGVVQSVGWERSISIEEFGPNEHEDWYDQVPSDGEIVSCWEEERSRGSSPVAGTEEVCGTPYTVDTGGGFAEVVQDCEYIVYDDKCTYTVVEWYEADTATLSGRNYSPGWPNESALSSEQRFGDDRSETYSIVFDADDDILTYETGDYELFMQCQIGSTWTLDVTTFGQVRSIRQ